MTADLIGDCLSIFPLNAPRKRSSRIPSEREAVTEYVTGKNMSGKSRNSEKVVEVAAIVNPETSALRLIFANIFRTFGW